MQINREEFWKNVNKFKETQTGELDLSTFSNYCEINNINEDEFWANFDLVKMMLIDEREMQGLSVEEDVLIRIIFDGTK